MKQGTVVRRGTKQDTLDWIQETIDMLNRYKAEVEAGEIVITSGDASVTSPVPEADVMTTKYVSISFDYVDCETSSIDRSELPEGTQVWQ